MLPISASIRVFLCIEPVDLRRGFDGLAQLVQDRLATDPKLGGLFLFTNRRGDQLRALCFDRNGVVLLSKRLHNTKFCWPTNVPTSTVRVELSITQFTALFAGLSLQPASVPTAWAGLLAPSSAH